jgi:hypothetical protein
MARGGDTLDTRDVALAKARRLASLVPVVARFANAGHSPDEIKRILELSDGEYERAVAWLHQVRGGEAVNEILRATRPAV